MKPIKMFVIDQSFEAREPGYWQAALAAIRDCGGITVVGSASTAQEAFEGTLIGQADVTVLSLSTAVPEMTGLLESFSYGPGADVPVIGLCDVVDEAALAIAISTGVRACVGRDRPEEIVTALIEVARGGVPIQRDIAGKPALLWNLALDLRARLKGTIGSHSGTSLFPDKSDNSSQRKEPPDCPISEREVSILEMVADGLSYREIGESLTIAERTVKNHMARSLEKLGARGRAHAVRMALQAGWICNGAESRSTLLQVAA
ncbi:MAG: response regulator transcription factor [Chloroflexi bacterium]|nr:response regulator transcription factor [Chloroflexota bacterium]